MGHILVYVYSIATFQAEEKVNFLHFSEPQGVFVTNTSYSKGHPFGILSLKEEQYSLMAESFKETLSFFPLESLPSPSLIYLYLPSQCSPATPSHEAVLRPQQPIARPEHMV